MPTFALLAIVAAGAGLALLVRYIISLEDAIDRDNEVTARDYPERGKAQRAVDQLDASGIPSMIRHGGFRGGGIYSVVVRPDQLDAARQILTDDGEQDEGT